jgi:hypothetical protein
LLNLRFDPAHWPQIVYNRGGEAQMKRVAALTSGGDAPGWRPTTPLLYQRVRVRYIEEQRRQPKEFEKRLNNFLAKTRQNKMFGGIE